MIRKLGYMLAVLVLVNLATLSYGWAETDGSQNPSADSEQEIIEIFKSDQNPKKMAVQLIDLIQSNRSMAEQTRRSCLLKLEEIGQVASKELVRRLKRNDSDAKEFLIQKSNSEYLRLIFQQDFKRTKGDLNLLDEIAIPPQAILNLVYSQESGMDAEEALFRAIPVIAGKLKETGNEKIKNSLILFFENVEVETDDSTSRLNLFRIYEEAGMSDDLYVLLSGIGIKLSESPLDHKQIKNIKRYTNEIIRFETDEKFSELKEKLGLFSDSLDRRDQDEIKEILRNAVPSMVSALGIGDDKLKKNVKIIIAGTSGVSTYELFKIYGSLEDGTEQKKEVGKLLREICAEHNDLISGTMIDLYMDYDLETDEITEVEYIASAERLFEYFSSPGSVDYKIDTSMLESIKADLKNEIGELAWDDVSEYSKNISSEFINGNPDSVKEFREKEPVLTEYIIDELVRRLGKTHEESYKANTILSYYFDDVSAENLIIAYQEGSLEKPAADVLNNIGWKAVPALIDHSEHGLIKQILIDKTIPKLVESIALNEGNESVLASGIYQNIVNNGFGDDPFPSLNKTIKPTYYILLICAAIVIAALWTFFTRQLNRDERKHLRIGINLKKQKANARIESKALGEENGDKSWVSSDERKLKLSSQNGVGVSSDKDQPGNNEETSYWTIEQLKFMGWKHVRGDTGDLTLSERGSFKETLLKGRLKQAIERINPQREGYGMVESEEIDRCIKELESVDFSELIMANNETTKLLLKGAIRGEEKDAKRINFIDYQNPENNEFLAISKFRVDAPEGENSIAPGIVLFVNGIPVVVMVCKDADSCNPIKELCSSNPEGMVEPAESDVFSGVDRLFNFNQFIVSAFNEKANAGTISTHPNNYLEWGEIKPPAKKDLKPQPGSIELSERELLIEGMLNPYNLINILQNFILFTNDDQISGKHISTYEQFNATNSAIEWLMNEQGIHKLEGYEQNRAKLYLSGASENNSTIAFMVQKMRTDMHLREYKVVLVTEGSDLETYLTKRIIIRDSDIRSADTMEELHRHLKDLNSNIIISNIQAKLSDMHATLNKRDLHGRLSTVSYFSAINETEKIVVIIDEKRTKQLEEQVTGIINSLPRSSIITFVEESADIAADGRGEIIYR